MTARALVTGISGFLGGYLAEHLLACGDAVLGTSVDGLWERRSAPGVRTGVELLGWDVSRPGGPGEDVWRRIVDFRPTSVYHLGGLSVPADCGTDRPTDAALAVNVAGTGRVLERLATLETRPRFLFVSTSHVYGPSAWGDPPVAEDRPAVGRSAYGQTKVMAETLIERARREQGFETIIARCFQQIGPRQGTQMMLPAWASQFAAGTDPVQVRTLDARVDVLDARDGVRALRLLMERQGSGVFNVGSGILRRTGDILDVMRRLADPTRAIVETSPGGRQDPIADIGRLVRATGWRATISLEETIADTLNWWKENLS